MNKAIQAGLTGIFITFILDFFLFLGIFLNYIHYYEIEVYYNILFADNQNALLFFLFSTILGFLVIYVKNYKFMLIILGVLFTLVFLTLIEGIGNYVGEKIFMQKNVSLQTAKKSYLGDILYNGRKKITFFDYERNKIIKINKKDIKK